MLVMEKPFRCVCVCMLPCYIHIRMYTRTHVHTHTHTQMLVMEKPFRFPLVLCCWMPWPFEMRVTRPHTGQEEREYLGRVLFEWKWWNCLW
jgi:hypothetical protein